MKKGLLLLPLLSLLLLTACGGSPAPAEPDILPEEPSAEAVFTLPETRDAEPVSAEAIVTEGRTPAEDYVLPPSPPESGYEYWHNMINWVSGGGLEILAESPAGDAAFYALPYSEDTHETALIRWGSSLAEFDWDFVTPRTFPPRMTVMDLGGDGTEELIVLCYTGSGTGVSIYDLHVVQKGPNGGLTDCAMPESLWREQLPLLLEFVRTGGRNFLILGRELVEIDPEIPEWAAEDRAEPSTGWVADFRLLPGEHAIQLMGAVDLWRTTNYVADYTAGVHFQDGVFTLSEFHLQ